MRLNKRLEEWFDVPDDPDKGKVLFVTLNEGDRAEIMQAASPTVMEITLQGEATRRSVYDRTVDRAMTVKKSIKDWKNFFDEEGKPIKCTDEAKERFSREDGFMAFVAECREKLDEMAAEQKKVKEKN